MESCPDPWRTRRGPAGLPQRPGHARRTASPGDDAAGRVPGSLYAGRGRSQHRGHPHPGTDHPGPGRVPRPPGGRRSLRGAVRSGPRARCTARSEASATTAIRCSRASPNAAGSRAITRWLPHRTFHGALSPSPGAPSRPTGGKSRRCVTASIRSGGFSSIRSPGSPRAERACCGISSGFERAGPDHVNGRAHGRVNGRAHDACRAACFRVASSP